MYLGELEEWDVYKRWISDSGDPEVKVPLKEFLCLEETDHCAKDPWGDFGNVPEKGRTYLTDDFFPSLNREVSAEIIWMYSLYQIL